MSAPRFGRDRYQVCDWQEYRHRDRRLVKHVTYRSAMTGMPVDVLVPTLLGRLLQLWRSWSEAR